MVALLVQDAELMGLLRTLKTASLKSLKDTKAIGHLPETEAHLGTKAHRDWRNLIWKRAGGRCQWPGCGRADPRMFADHIVERKDGGALTDPANGWLLCSSHHVRKTNQERAKRMALKA